MKKTLTLFLFLFSFALFSQNEYLEKPDYKKIKKNIKKEESNLFYTKLMERFRNADSTLTIEEKRHLYYGYTHQEEYSPYHRSDFGDSIRNILIKEIKTKDDFKSIVRFGDSILTKQPFDIRTMNYQLYAFDELKDSERFNETINKAKVVVDALMSSGDGTSKEKAFYVIDTTHEYELLGILGFQFGGSQSLIEHYDYLTVAENDFNIEGFYFDVTPCLNSMSKMFEK